VKRLEENTGGQSIFKTYYIFLPARHRRAYLQIKRVCVDFVRTKEAQKGKKKKNDWYICSA